MMDAIHTLRALGRHFRQRRQANSAEYTHVAGTLKLAGKCPPSANMAMSVLRMITKKFPEDC